MPLPLIPVVAVSALGLGGLIYAAYKATAAPSPAELDALAAQVAVSMPRGERAFRPEIAQGIVLNLASRFYDWPSQSERRVVELVTNKLGTPISKDLSAAGWVSTLNASQSILAMLTSASTDAHGTQMLRAVAPGTEAQYAGPGMMYAVLLYAGCLDKQLAPPGVPPNVVSPNAPVPVPDLARACDELAGSPELLSGFMSLLQTGSSIEGDEQMVVQLLRDGFQVAPVLLHERANDLRTFAGQPSMPMPTAFTPGVVDAPNAPPAFHPGVVDDTPPAPPVNVTFNMDTLTAQKGLNILRAEGKLIAGPPIAEDGAFGPETSAALSVFQGASGTPASGQLDQATKNALAANVDGTLQNVLGGHTPGALSVRNVQKGLNLLGASPKLAEDNALGPATRSAIAKFQQDDGLPVNPNILNGVAPTSASASQYVSSTESVSGYTFGATSTSPGLRWRRMRVITPAGAKAIPLRASPPRGRVLAALKPGAVVSVRGPVQGGWICATYAGKTGWAPAKHLAV